MFLPEPSDLKNWPSVGVATIGLIFSYDFPSKHGLCWGVSCINSNTWEHTPVWTAEILPKKDQVPIAAKLRPRVQSKWVLTCE
jgi:hypothetical protein